MGAMGAMMAMSAASSVGGAVTNAQSLKASGAYQQAIADTNAKIADLEATQTLEAGDKAASRRNLEGQKVQGAARAATGASGVDMSSPTAARVIAESGTAGAIDELTIRNNAARQAWGYKVQSMTDTFQGKFAQLTAKAQVNQTILTGGLNAIQGPMSIYANYQKYSRYMGSGSDPVTDFKTN